MRISIPQFPLSFTEESATGCGRRHPDAEEQRIWIPHIRASFRTLPGRHGRSRARPLALRKDHTIDRPRPYAGVTAKRRSPETVCRSGEGGGAAGGPRASLCIAKKSRPPKKSRRAVKKRPRDVSLGIDRLHRVQKASDGGGGMGGVEQAVRDGVAPAHREGLEQG